MRKAIVALAVLGVVCLLATAAHASLYRVYITRIDQDLYKDNRSGAIIQTRFCYEYCYGEEAVLKYDQYAYDNKLIFRSGQSYDVVRLMH